MGDGPGAAAGLQFDHHTHLMQWVVARAFTDRRLELHQPVADLGALRTALEAWWRVPEHGARLRSGSTSEVLAAGRWLHVVGLMEPLGADGRRHDADWRAALDAGDWSWWEAGAEVPVALRTIGGHRAWLSPAAVRRLTEVGPTLPAASGMAGAEHDGAWTRLAPLLAAAGSGAWPAERGAALVEAAVYDIETLLTPVVRDLADALRSQLPEIARRGVGGLHDIARDPYPAVYALAHHEGWLDLDVGLLHRVLSAEEVLAVEDLGPEAEAVPCAAGGRLWSEGCKLFLDGSLGARTAALRAPYADAPSGAEAPAGLLLVEDARLDAILDACEARNWPLAMHAIGDAAVEQAVAALERRPPAARDDGTTIRHRIEHAQLVPPDVRQRLLAVRDRLTVVPQVSFSSESSPSGLGAVRLGPERRRWLNPVRWFLAAGFDVRYSSDMLPFDVDQQRRIWSASATDQPTERWWTALTAAR